MPDILAVLTSFDGIATRQQMIDAGLSGVAISRATRAGGVRRIRRAHYALHDAPVTGVVAVRLGGRLGCVSAAQSYGIWANAGDHVHIALPANASRLRTNRALVPSSEPLTTDRFAAEVVLHWSDITVGRRANEQSWRVPLRRALAQLAQCQPRRDVLAAFESAVSLRLLSLTDSQRLLEASAPARLGRLTLGGLDGSGAETYLADALRELGVSFLQQVPFDGVGFVDFLVEGRLIIEVDGYHHHSGKAAFRRDRGRDRIMLGRGILTVRIPADEVIADPLAAALAVVEILAGMRVA